MNYLNIFLVDNKGDRAKAGTRIKANIKSRLEESKIAEPGPVKYHHFIQ